MFAGFACLVLAACSDPVADFPRLSEQDLPDDPVTVEVAAAPAVEGQSLLERLMGDPSDTAPAEADDGTAEPTMALAEEKPKGLWGLLSRAAPPKTDVAQDTDTAVQAVLTEDQAPATVQPVALAPEPEATPEQEPDPAPGTKHKSIFGITAPKPAVTSEIAPGTVLPYGQIARICGLPKRELGQQILQYPEKRPQHRVYDTNPGSAGPRTFYVTGFDDGCARQFTASLAIFGSASMHEQLRYGLPSEVQPYSDTDKAYEKLKSRVCKVPRKKPCGAKVSRMEQNTVFLSIYERFGSNARWKNLLLHDGEVLAQDIKGG